jgi:SAM-dependent methyltransferase
MTATRQDPAALQAELWGEHARDWAEVMEGERPWLGDAYRLVLERLAVAAGTALLDVGCGSGRFCRIAADRGVQVAGIDVTPAFVGIARERTPEGDFRTGDMMSLPWADGAFDVVTGFNSFFFAADLARALREARRVLRPGGRLALTAFGRPERCESAPVFELLGGLMPQHAVEQEEGPALHGEGVLESFAAEAGLTPVDAGYLEVAEEQPDIETLLRGWLAIGPLVQLTRILGAQVVRETLTEALAPLRLSGGGYRIEDEYRYLIATS